MKLSMGSNDWGGGRGRSDDNNRPDPTEGDYETMRKLQFTVASSTFGGIAFVGLFCTCLWLSCCRHKRTTRIRGRTWNTNSSFAVPNGTTLTNPYQYDPQGLNMNPYMITPNYFSDVNLNTSNGLYHPSAFGFPEDLKPPADHSTTENTNENSNSTTDENHGNTYKPFFKKPEWNPPDPPSYDTLGFVNPGYETNSANADMDDNGQIKKELITEKVLSSILATCDPSKRPSLTTTTESIRTENTLVRTADDEGQGGQNESESHARANSSAPPESIVSIESKDGGHPYQIDGVKSPPGRSEGQLEELTPPPFNPSYLFN